MTVVAERSQIPVALAAEPRVGEVMDLEAPRLAATLAAPAGPRDRPCAPGTPVR